MLGFARKHFELVAVTTMVLSVGGYCVYEKSTASEKASAPICSDVQMSGKYTCIGNYKKH